MMCDAAATGSAAGACDARRPPASWAMPLGIEGGPVSTGPRHAFRRSSFWLDGMCSGETGGWMSLQRMDADTAETVAGVVRLLRRAAQLVWGVVDAERAWSPRQMLALAIDLAADDERNLLPDAIPLDGPVPVGNEPGRSPTLRRAPAATRRHHPRSLDRAACPAGGGCPPGVEGEHRCRRLTCARSGSYWPTATRWPARRSSTQHPITRRLWCEAGPSSSSPRPHCGRSCPPSRTARRGRIRWNGCR
jgi:hypothetical protein